MLCDLPRIFHLLACLSCLAFGLSLGGSALATPASQPTSRKALPAASVNVQDRAPVAKAPAAPTSTRSAPVRPAPVSRPAAPTTQPTARHTDGFVHASPWQIGLDPRWVDHWVAEARKADSDALVILRDGKLIGSWYFGRPQGAIETMSMTKSLVSLAIGKLFELGKIKSLDTPVFTFFPKWPSWKEKPYSQITLKHLLAHTSGIKALANTKNIYASKDFVTYALKAPLASPPGDRFRYNNRAVNLLAGIVKRVSGQRLDRFLQAHIFGPMGIAQVDWSLDKAGNPHAMSGAKMTAIDLAKIGEMMRLGGVFRGKRILSQSWVKRSITPHPHRLRRYGRHPHGLLWWLLPEPYTEVITSGLLQEWKKAGIRADWINKLKPMVGQKFYTPVGGYFVTRRKFYKALARYVGPRYRSLLRSLRRKKLERAIRTYEPHKGFYAQGYLGQYLIVLPQAKLVVVRQIRWRPGQKRSVTNMGRLARQLAKATFAPVQPPKEIKLLQRLYLLGQKAATTNATLDATQMLWLHEQIQHTSPLVRDMSAWVVGQYGQRTAIAESALLARLAVESAGFVKESIWKALGHSGGEASGLAALALLKTEKGKLSLRRTVATALGHMAVSEPKLLEPALTLVVLLKPWEVQLALAKGLVKIGPKILPVVLKIWGDASDQRRRLAVEIVIRLPLSDEQMVRFGLRMLRDREAAIRGMGRRKLVELGAKAKAAIPFFRQMMRRSSGWRAKLWRRDLFRIQMAVQQSERAKLNVKPAPRKQRQHPVSRPSSRRSVPASP